VQAALLLSVVWGEALHITPAVPQVVLHGEHVGPPQSMPVAGNNQPLMKEQFDQNIVFGYNRKGQCSESSDRKTHAPVS
jgi:hypothetical protein